MAWGNANVTATTVTRYLSPVGHMSGASASPDPQPWLAQATGRALRFQIRVRAGAGNGATIDYEAMLLVGGVPTSFPDAMIISLASTFSGVAAITVPVPGNALADGDEIIVEVRKALAVGTSPDDIQAFLQIEDICGGGGGSCCPPSYLSQAQFNAYAEIYITGQVFAVDLDASLCGQPPGNPGILGAVIRPSFFGGAPGTPPVVVIAETSPGPPPIARIQIDATGATDGRYVLELTNDCGCCYLIPLEGVSV